MWNPSTWACECDMWCKPGQYLDYEICICKNKLIGKIISECTSIINETMINNKKYIYIIMILHLFSLVYFHYFIYRNYLLLRIHLF